MSRDRRRIAFLVNSLDSEYAQALWHAVRRAAAQHNAEVMAFTGMFIGSPDPSQATRNHVYDLVSPLRVDGVVLVSSLIAHHCGVEGIATLCRRYAPMPVCSIGLEVPGICSLVVDNRAGMAQGVRHLIEAHGCRRIAFIAAQSTSPESNLRLLGYRDALREFDVPVDEQLIFHSDFTTPGGRAAARQLLASGHQFDAIVAANDYMAIGALEALEAAGISVPGDLALCGFDDSSDAAACRPTLTSLRQPAGWLGVTAVELILEQLDGRVTQPCRTGAVDLVRRESCGCSYSVEASVRPIEGEPVTVLEVVRSQKVGLGSLLLDTILDPNGALEDWTTELVNALETQLVDGGRIFESTLNGLLARAVDARINLEEFQRALTRLRAELRNRAAPDLEAHRKLERIWHAARMAVAAASIRRITMHRSVLMLATTLLGRTSERFSTSLSFPVLRTVIKEALPSLGIEQGAISLYEHGIGSSLIPLVVLQQSTECVVEERPFQAELLAPDEAFHSNQPWHSIVMPLTSLEECYGICVCSSDAVPNTYEALRQQISASIRGIQLHRSMVSQVAMREKLDQQRLSTEARMAIDIQTAMLPREIRVPGLDFAHLMIPANESGGDYYDVLNQGTGAWIAVGDVSGHGLGAGIIMLMLQCTIASAVRAHPTGKPSEILEAVNASIFDNVRHRLGRDDHATLMLMHYERDGQILLSGLHEPLLVYRAATQHCESITGPGFWIGVVQDLPEEPDDLSLQLQDGDLLVMYTDGVTEPRNAHREQFGVERLAALIESLHGFPVTEIRDRVVAAVRAWASNLDDDLSLVLARYHAT